MSYTAVVKSPHAEMYGCFLNEKLAGLRSSVKIRKDKDQISFEVTAEDPVALRASLNAITKLLSVCEKSGKI